MGNDDAIGLVIGLVIFAVVAAVYIALIVLGVSIAKRKNRSPHWMWFAIHPVGLLITLIVMACLSPLKRCPNCAQTTQQYARLCGFCGCSYEAPGAYMPPQAGVYMPPQHY
jgi:ABC-type multidrug transport system permease subunit